MARRSSTKVGSTHHAAAVSPWPRRRCRRRVRDIRGAGDAVVGVRGRPRSSCLPLRAAITATVLLCLGGVPAAAQVLFTYPYLVTSRDGGCMQVNVQTDTSLGGGWVRWGYSAGDLKYLEDARAEHQNIHNEAYPFLAAEDFIRWDAWICAEPGQRVFYTFFVSNQQDYDDDNALYALEANFTMPPPPNARHVTFFGYGDTRECDTAFSSVTSALWSAVASDPANTKTFLIHSGDVVYNGGETHLLYSDSSWGHYFNKYSEARYLLEDLPVVVAIGNHDFNWENHGNHTKYFYTNFPYHQYVDSIGMVPYLDDDGDLQSVHSHPIDDAYYSFDYGPVHVAVLNSYYHDELGDLGSCHMGSSLAPGTDHSYQYDWLAQDLAATDKPWKVLLVHVSPLSCGCNMTHPDVAARQAIEDLAAAHGVSLVVSGHDHYYKRIEYNGIQHLVLGGGGAALDKPACEDGSDPCRGCFFQFARFDIVDDGHLQVEVHEVATEQSAKTTVVDSFTVTRQVGAATFATFAASSTSTDYRTPIRFTCTTEGSHADAPSGSDGPHQWDLGDGTTSSEPSPLHTYPRPASADGIDHHTVSLRVWDGGQWLLAETDVTVYVGGNLQVVTDVNPTATYALFLTPPGQAFDEDRDLRVILNGEDTEYFLTNIVPGVWKVKVRAVGYDEWNGEVTVPPDGSELIIARPVQQDHFQETVAVGSVPPGADVTVTYNETVLTGTTPFYGTVCCTGLGTNSCVFTYEVTNGPVAVTRTGEVTTGPDCGPTGLYSYLVDVRAPVGVPFTGSDLTVIRQPSDQRTVEGGSARLRVSARSSNPLSYRWYEGPSGDTSRPIHGATGAELVTPPLTESRSYWVRVHEGAAFVDSRTATVTTTATGPRLLGIEPRQLVPGEQVRLLGGPFDPQELEDNHVYFGDSKAVVTHIEASAIDVIVPTGVAGRRVVPIHAKANGVWSRRLVWIAGPVSLVPIVLPGAS